MTSLTAMPNPTFDRTATSGAQRAFARIFFVSRDAAGVVRSTLRWASHQRLESAYGYCDDLLA